MIGQDATEVGFNAKRAGKTSLQGPSDSGRVSNGAIQVGSFADSEILLTFVQIHNGAIP
jgi:hypothetical protein